MRTLTCFGLMLGLCAQQQILPNLTVLSVAPLLGEAIKRIHHNESVSRLFE